MEKSFSFSNSSHKGKITSRTSKNRSRNRSRRKDSYGESGRHSKEDTTTNDEKPPQDDGGDAKAETNPPMDKECPPNLQGVVLFKNF